MLLLALKLPLLFFLFYSYGLAGRKLWGASGTILTLYSGMAITGGLALWVSAVFPLNVWAFLVVGMGGLAAAFQNKKEWSNELLKWKRAWRETPHQPFWLTVFVALTIFVLWLSSRQSISQDEAMYHAQFMEWSRRFGPVPGLANVDPKLGFDSSWHLLAALTGVPLGNGFSNHLNGLLVLAQLGYSFVGLRRCLQGEVHLGNVVQALQSLVILFPLMMIYHVVDPSADLFIYCLTLILVTEWVKGPLNVGVWGLLAAFAVTVKLSSAAMVLVPLGFALGALLKARWKPLLQLALMGMLFAAPWLYRNYVLTGYPLFPTKVLSVGRPDWQLPEARLKNNNDKIYLFALSMYKQDRVPTVGKSFWEARKIWFTKNLRGFEKMLLLAVALCLPLLWWRAYRQWRIGPAKGVALGLLVWLPVPLLMWFATAPDPRFAYGTLFAVLLLAVGCFLFDIQYFKNIFLNKKAFVAGAWAAVLLLSAGLSAYSYLKVKRTFVERKTILESAPTAAWLWPTPYPAGGMDTLYLGGEPIYITRSKYSCWDQFPCTHWEELPFEMRGTGLGDGFRTRADFDAGVEGVKF